MDAEYQDGLEVARSELGAISAHASGAQVLSWDSVEAGQMLFLSSRSRYGAGISARGGVPICFPWFGQPRNPEGAVPSLGEGLAFGSHGFARKVLWRPAGIGVLDDGWRTLTYELTEEDLAEQGYADVQPFFAAFRATFEGTALELSLAVANTGNDGFRFEEALHTYFKVGRVEDVLVDGLEGTTYFDKAAGVAATQVGPIAFGSEVDRVYQSTAPVVLADSSLDRRVRISKSGSATTVVWNPGPVAARDMADLGEGQWRDFVCVETANTAESAVTLEPGQSHKMTARYEVETLGL